MMWRSWVWWRRISASKGGVPEKVTLNMLWGLQAALLDLPWNELPPDIKEELMKQVEEE